MISAKLRDFQEEISLVCSQLGRDPDDIILVGATKYAEADAVLEAVKAGLCHVGENRVQDAQRKFSALKQAPHEVTKHFIGHLQSNKVKSAVEEFDLIQSVDSVKLVELIEKYASRLKKTVDILIQVNVSGEEQKFGVAPEEADALLEEAASCEHIRVWGLMTIAPFTGDADMVRSCFKGLKAMYDRYAEIYQEHIRVRMSVLSMGMTDDYVIALEEGANMVRIGTKLFGERVY